MTRLAPAEVQRTLGVRSYRQDGRVLRTETEWDPDVYSKGDARRG